MKSEKSSELSRLLSPPMKQITLPVSDRLTKSEIELLRQRKKQISDYAQKELKEKSKDAVRIQTMSRQRTFPAVEYAWQPIDLLIRFVPMCI